MRDVMVVTGGSRGIGAETARLAAARGYDVCVGYARASDAAREVVAACEEAGARAHAVAGDVAVEADVLRLFAEAEETLGPVTALVNNAGALGPRTRVADLDEARLARTFAVNATGAFLCAREAVRRMGRGAGGPGGAVVNVSSRAAVLGAADEYVDYAAAKAAVDTMTVGLAHEVAADGVRVNAVRPGLIETGIHASGGQPDRVARLGPSVPMGRGGTAAEVAQAILWLLSEEASYVTGALLDVGGGR